MPANDHFMIESLSSLYTAVQSQKLFPDSKHFVDSIPNQPPAALLARYEQEKAQPGFDLRAFVEKYFTHPKSPDTGYRSDRKPLLQHLNDLWDVLTRAPSREEGTLMALPHPYIVPGGRFREVYYWDTYFTMLGLQVAGRTEMIRHMVNNFSRLLDGIGFIPNANRTYYLGRSQPPFFSLMVDLLAESDPGARTQYLPQLEKEYAFWMAGGQSSQACFRRTVKMPGGHLLNRYWDDYDTPRPEAYLEDVQLAARSGRPATLVYRHIRAAAESGWDFSCRWFADGQHMETIHTTDLLPVDLNCLLLHLEQVLATTHGLNGHAGMAAAFEENARRRIEAIQHYHWNPAAGYYFDFNHITDRPSSSYSLAAVYPLFFKVASAAQAAAVAEVLENRFLQEGGLVTTPYASGQQWDAPNGWAPLQWMAYRGLLNYGHTRLAETIKQRWMAVNENVYAATGKMMEKYNVVNPHTLAGGGEYPNQDGFGWTNGVYLKMAAERP